MAAQTQSSKDQIQDQAQHQSKRIVLVTGANQGLGLEIVKKLAAENSNYTLLLCSRDLQRGKDAAAGIKTLAPGTSVQALQLDVLSDESIAEAKTLVEQQFGKLDVLVNNAGISHAAGSEREAMLRVYETNVVGVVLVTKAFLPLLMKSDVKRLVIMSSDVGSIGYAVDPSYKYYFFQDTTYKPSKAAVNMVGAVMSVLHGKDGLRVNLINPGLRDTSLHDRPGVRRTVSNLMEEPMEDGALEACRVIVLGNEGEVLSYTEDHNKTIPW